MSACDARLLLADGSVAKCGGRATPDAPMRPHAHFAEDEAPYILRWNDDTPGAHRAGDPLPIAPGTLLRYELEDDCALTAYGDHVVVSVGESEALIRTEVTTGEIPLDEVGPGRPWRVVRHVLPPGPALRAR